MALTLFENASILVGLAAIGFLIWLVLRPLRMDITIKHEDPPEDEERKEE